LAGKENFYKINAKMKVGDKASLSKEFSKEEVLMFSKSTMDENPIHFDEAYASNSRFKKCIVQGPMVISLVGGVLGSTLPGNGTIYLSQFTKFLKPVFIGDNVTANVEVLKIREDKPIITLRTWVENQYGDCVIDGEAVVMLIKENENN
jgi:acyl dehydratase